MLIGAPELQRIREYRPRVRPEQSLLKAAVAIILRDGEQGTEFLLMQRAKHERDPWSGQMSFPGGKIDPEDINAKAAAVREAHEEVGALLREQDYIGQIDDLYGLKVDGIFSVHVSCFVFKPSNALDLVGNEEVADMVWLPIKYLATREHAYPFKHPKDPAMSMPAVMIDKGKDQILWGLSLRMLANLHELLEWPMPVLNADETEHLRGLESRNLSRENADKITQKILQMVPK